ncbi:uncharacterized protein N0V89_000487 [Didymosphaeria variabile]|uniref:2-nitropropane dioxygenase n=1 Tax=Didymosphaeria variabile TaxID=1932322 RepID=A0A9W9CEZ6_9PLEO|nr:uncharacterized protein N0V89_000487 [Didymosphaeria variabile]KAJ4359928.1 hypothetical protein N0V89_000487 [Didymosphaeria variabile]
MAPSPLSTPLTTLVNIQHPIMLAGMDQVAGPELAAAVTNAGGFGTLGGARYTPKMLREMITEMKDLLKDKNAPFGVDLLLPQVGGSARKTNHVHKACRAGADIIIAQGGEAGGHTGDIATSVLIPACADICKQYASPLTSKPVILVAAGGVNDGRSVASALMLGASGVWIGTRFIVSNESKAPQTFKDQVIAADYDSWVKLTVWSGRPLRALRNPWLTDWEVNRQQEIKELSDKGIVPLEFELDRLHKEGKLTEEIEDAAALRQVVAVPIGVVGGSVNKPGQSASEIVHEIVHETVVALNNATLYVNAAAKL